VVVGGRDAALLAFVVTAVVIVGLLLFLSAALSAARGRLVESLQAKAPRMKRWGGLVLWGVGIWMLLLAGLADFFAGIYPV